VIPGSANRVAFEESLNPFFKSMKEMEAAWTKLPEFSKVSLLVVPAGKELDSEGYAEDATKPVIQTSTRPSSSQKNIVLGTSALGVLCVFQDHIKGVEYKPKIVLAAKVILEKNLRYMFPGGQEDQKPTSTSDQRTSQPEDGRDT
jgi:hypothetical protein